MPKVTEEYKTERREQLISAAEAVFLRLGYARATVKDIMDEAKVSRGGFYLYFGNKAEIFEALMARQDRRFLDALSAIWKSQEPVGPSLMQMVTPSGEIEDQDRQRISMVVEYHLQHCDDPERRDLILARYDRVTDLLTRVLQHGVDRGEFHPRLPVEDIARFLLASQDGWAIHVAVLGASRYDATSYRESITLWMRQSLGMELG